MRTRGFLELSAAALLPLLRSDKLGVDEAELIQAARSWARVGAVSRAWGSSWVSGTWHQGVDGKDAPVPGAVLRVHLQAVLERPVVEVAAPVVPELRLALLAPAELSALEEQNRREPLFPVWI